MTGKGKIEWVWLILWLCVAPRDSWNWDFVFAYFCFFYISVHPGVSFGHYFIRIVPNLWNWNNAKPNITLFLYCEKEYSLRRLEWWASDNILLTWGDFFVSNLAPKVIDRMCYIVISYKYLRWISLSFASSCFLSQNYIRRPDHK